jgi:hypothetical protein
MKWGEPPMPAPKDNHQSPEWVAELMAHPKRWALVMEGLTKSQAGYYQYEIGFSQWHRLPYDTAWEAKQRRMEDGTYGVWARFLK